MSERSSWADLFRTLLTSFSDLTKAELQALKGDLAGSSRHLVWGIVWLVAGASFLFWGLAVLTWAAVEAVALVWPRWLAAVSVGGGLLAVFLLLVLIGRSQLRRFEAPMRTVKRRAAEHRSWLTGLLGDASASATSSETSAESPSE